MKKNNTKVGLLFCFLLLSLKMNGHQLFQNSNVDTTRIEETQQNIDALGRSTPRGAVTGLFKSLANEDYAKASKYLNLSKIKDKQKDSLIIVLVKKIEIVFNQKATILPVSIISNSSSGDTNDGLIYSLENIGSLNLNEKSDPLLLELVPSKEYTGVWLISSETIQTIIEYIEANNYLLSEKIEKKGFFSSRWKGAPLKDWIGITLMAFASYFLAWLLTLFMSWLVRLLWRNFPKSKYSTFLHTLLLPLRLIIAVTIVVNMVRLLGISIVVRQAFGVVNLIAVWTAVFIFIWLLINTLSSYGEERLRENKSFGGLSAISFFKNSAKFILVVIALLIAFHTLGFNVTGAFAALGVGGIALALGAQKTIENIIGGLSVVFDQPVRVGDSCKFGDTTGTVERIGMRSTRIRTAERTIVTIPNSDFSSRSIENYSKRDMFLYQTIVGLRSETSSHQMRFVLVELRKILYAHPKVDSKPARVRFLGYGTDALNVEIFAYTHAKDWDDYLGIQEDINLRLAEVIEDSGTDFANRTQTVYISRDKGISQTKKEEIEKKVNKWIENNELHLPEFDEQTKAALKGSLKYPPGESSQK